MIVNPRRTHCPLHNRRFRRAFRHKRREARRAISQRTSWLPLRPTTGKVSFLVIPSSLAALGPMLLCENLLDDVAVDVGQSAIDTVLAVGQSLMVDA